MPLEYFICMCLYCMKLTPLEYCIYVCVCIVQSWLHLSTVYVCVCIVQSWLHLNTLCVCVCVYCTKVLKQLFFILLFQKVFSLSYPFPYFLLFPVLPAPPVHAVNPSLSINPLFLCSLPWKPPWFLTNFLASVGYSEWNTYPKTQNRHPQRSQDCPSKLEQ